MTDALRSSMIMAERMDRQIVIEATSNQVNQEAAVYPRLAQLGFAFQKVGPALTFAYREALYALDQLRSDKGALQGTMETVMLDDPSKWQGHCHGDENALYAQRHFGLSDRIRYYWPQAKAQSAVQSMLSAFDRPIADTDLATVFDTAVLARAEALKGTQVQRLIDAQIESALAHYFFEEAV